MRHFSIPFEADPMCDLNRIRTTLSVEAFSMNGIAQSLSEFLPDVKDHFQKFAQSFGHYEKTITLTGNERQFVTQVMGMPYLNMTDWVAFVPEGMIVSYLEYITYLSDAVAYCQQSTLKAVNDFTTTLAKIITNRESRYSMASQVAEYTKREQEIKSINARLGKCFAAGSTKTQVSYGDVIDRNVDWKDVIQFLARDNNIIAHIPRDTMQKKAAECDKLLAAIVRQIKSGEFEGVAPEVINNLASGAYQCALEMEFFSVTYYKLMSLTNAVSETMRSVSANLTERAAPGTVTP